MAAAHPHSTEHVIASATEDRTEEPAAMKEQTTEVGHEKEAVGQLRSFGSESDLPVYMPNLYAPNAHASYFKGYENFPGEWNELSVYGNTSGWNRESPGIYNHNAALGFHNGYNYNPNVPCGPYCSVTTSMPVVNGDAPLYPSQQYTYSGPTYYQQVIPPSIPHITSQLELNLVVPSDQQVGQRAGYSSSLASSRKGNFTGNLGELSFQDQQQACDGFRYSGLCSDWPKPSDKHQPRTLGSQQQRSFIGFGSRPFSCKDSTYERGFSHGFSGGCHGINYGSRCGLENGSLCSCTSASDILTEQNRGPRALKSQRQILTGSYLYTDSNRDISVGKMRDGSYNHPDFVIEHKDAKFFVIKSYSEDNIHRSIKYGVWASTPNGNQKLNAAYHEAKEKLNNCPVFLFFSANASAQFCGVAEMVGPVDFEKSVNYWQQDKWSGQFPVKWHIVKDVPNSQFRHIVLENNDNKPVTNSRDTQEVRLEQGVEMLNIFKNYETSISILDDFDFYEERQKALQERKSREHTNLLGGMVGGTEKRNVVTVPNEFIETMTKSFAQVVQLNPCSKDISAADRAGRRSDVPLAPGQEAETAAVTVSPGVHKT